MKTISFFSEKGGVGKSSFSILYASWLHYRHGIKVGLADFNARILHYRSEEVRKREALMAKDPAIQPFNQDGAWPIVGPTYLDLDEISKGGSQIPHAVWFENEFRKGKLKGCDVILCDFPGSLTGKEFINIAGMGLLSYVVVPTEKDPMTLASTFKIHSILQRQNHSVFINKAQLGLRNLRSQYLKFAEELVKKGLPMLPDMVTYSERMMSIDKIDNIRSTFGFPDFDEPEYGKSKDLGIGNLFIDVTRELQRCPDIRNTTRSDLSFVDSLTKVQDSRQFKGSSYPRYEI